MAGAPARATSLENRTLQPSRPGMPPRSIRRPSRAWAGRSMGEARPRSAELGLEAVGPAFRAGIADRIQHVANSGDRLVRKDAGRWILPSDEKGVLTSVRIGTIRRPPMRLAFTDDAGLEQNHPGPAFDCPEGGLLFLHHQHRHHSCATNRKAHPAFRAANTWQGFRMAGASAFPRVPRTKLKFGDRFRMCLRRTRRRPNGEPHYYGHEE